MNCPHCQAVIPDDASQCPFCEALFLPLPAYQPYRLQFNKLMRDTSEIYKQHFGTMCLIGLLYTIPGMADALAGTVSTLLQQSNPPLNPAIAAGLIGVEFFCKIVQAVCSIYFFAGAVQHGLFLARGGSGFQIGLMFPGLMTFLTCAGSQILVCMISSFFPLIITCAAMCIVFSGIVEDIFIVSGMILIAIVWALFFATRLALNIPPIVDRNADVLDSFRYSWQMTSGNFWKVLVSLFVLALAGITGALLCGVGIILTIAILPLGYSLIYLQLTGQPNVRDYSSLPVETLPHELRLPDEIP
ncbi:MAG: glycerophosphoryl diester phosphodiesterase membrane domain-containing protein [Planctomycetaceae bacterium]|jgi:hypothetical protein|nr:glycerophosphoryl diester phosphodiesterase membrane domain-containing protein [Planctomycetaceae bacterium]